MSFDPTQTTRILVAKAKRRIVPNWRSRLSDYSTRALALGVAIPTTWAALPDKLTMHMPANYVAWAVFALNAWGLVGKFITQPPKE